MTKEFLPNDLHIVISGGSRGLGRTIVSGLLKAGYRVSSFSRSRTSFVDEISQSNKFFFMEADLADGASVSSFVKSAEKKFGKPFGLINCAAIANDGLFVTMPEELIRQMLAVNGEGTLRLTRLVARRMMTTRSGGVILNVSSISSLRGFRGMAAYAFTKGGLDAFTRALARELGNQNIRVNSIAPGYYNTEMSRNLSDKQQEQILRRTPLGRLGVPEDVVGSVLFFLSDQSSFITGQVLVIDGGNSI
jgi:3-oxoacyl-[acyl-carrier protein] reductase